MGVFPLSRPFHSGCCGVTLRHGALPGLVAVPLGVSLTTSTDPASPMHVGAARWLHQSQNSLVVFFLFFSFVSGLDFIGGEGSNYPRKFDSAPGTIHPGAPTVPDPFTFIALFPTNFEISVDMSFSSLNLFTLTSFDACSDRAFTNADTSNVNWERFNPFLVGPWSSGAALSTHSSAASPAL